MSYKIVFFSIFVTFFLILTSISNLTIGLEIYIWISFIYISLILGVCSAEIKHPWVRELKKCRTYLDKKTIYIVGWIGFFAFFLRYVDKFLIRGASLSLNFTETLNYLQSSGSTFLGFLTAPLIFLCLFPYVYNLKNGNRSLFWFFVFWLPAIDALFFGQRFVLLLSMFIFSFSQLILKERSAGLFVKLFSILSLGIGLAAYIINSRYAGYGVDVFYSLENSAYAEFLDLPEIVKNSNSLPLGLFFNVVFYLQHGMYELQWVVERNTYDFSYGAFNFPAFFKILEYLGVYVDPWSGFERKGIYLSFFGLAWFDFSFFALFYSFLMGFFLRKSELSFKRNFKVDDFLLFLFLCYVTVLMPVTSMIGYGFGNYFLCSILIYKIIFSLRKIFS